MCPIKSLNYMSETTNSIIRSRVPNGVAAKRLRVALPETLLEAIEADADKNRRTVSNMAALIIAEYYAAKSVDRRRS